MKYNYEDLIENINDGIYFTDKKRKIIYWNKGAEKITGFSSDEVTGSHCYDNLLIHVDNKGNSLCKGFCPLAKTIRDGTSREAEIFLHHKKGHRVPVLVRTVTLRNESGEIAGGAELFTDISPKFLLQHRIKELEDLALIDNLTKLSNRNHILPELEARLQEMKRYGLSFGVLFIDIDHFKKFNDTYGHDAGDLVLKTVAATLISQSRPFDLYGRWGGEEIVAIIRNVDMEALKRMSERCRVLVAKSVIHFNGHHLKVTVSIGATLVRQNDDVDSIIKRADELMYKSKVSGRNRLTAG